MPIPDTYVPDPARYDGRMPYRRSGRSGIVLPAVLTALLLPFRDALGLSTVLLAFLLGVIATSLVGGLAPAVVTAIEASLLVNYFFVPPVGTFTIAEPENAFAIAVFIGVGAVVATIVDRSAARAAQAARRHAFERTGPANTPMRFPYGVTLAADSRHRNACSQTIFCHCCHNESSW